MQDGEGVQNIAQIIEYYKTVYQKIKIPRRHPGASQNPKSSLARRIIGMVNVTGRALHRNYPSWDAGHDGIVRHILGNYCIGADRNVVANPHPPKDLGAWPDKNVVSDYRHPSPLAAVGLTNGDPLRKIAIVPDYDTRIDRNSPKCPI